MPRRPYLEWIAEDRRRARIVFTALAGGVALGTSIAAAVLASEGSALRWLVAIAGLATGILVLLVIRRASQGSSARLSRVWILVGWAVVIGTGPFLQHARPTIQIATLAATAGYLAALVALASIGPAARP